jgi:hypothetical protein
VIGAEDNSAFVRLKKGFVPSSRVNLPPWPFSTATPAIGQTQTADFLALSTEEVKGQPTSATATILPARIQREIIRRSKAAESRVLRSCWPSPFDRSGVPAGVGEARE